MDEPEQPIQNAIPPSTVPEEGLKNTDISIEPSLPLANPLPSEICLNCGTTLSGKFCYQCGQKNIPNRQTLGELWTNFISSFWSYEGKFFQTTKYIITRPGFLAIEYNKGKRESFYHPARMYVFISFVFFLLFFSLPDSKDDGQTTLSTTDSLRTAKPLSPSQNPDSLVNNTPLDSAELAEVEEAKIELAKTKIGKQNMGFSINSTKYKTKEAYDSAQLTKPENERAGWLVSKLAHQAIELNQRSQEEIKNEFKESFSNNFSKILFFLLPFFALILKLLYIRQDYFYSEHLVFSIYYYNFFYLAASVQMLVSLVPWLFWLAVIIGCWIFIYLLLAMKRMYGQRWGKTILKFSLIVISFSVMIMIGFGVALFSIFFSM
jgi:Protein of unknown function (DUF3667)